MAKASFASLFSTQETLTGFTFTNEAMKVALAKAQESKAVKAAEQSAALLSHLDKHNDALLSNLRRARKTEKAAKDGLEKFKEAAQYFLDTGNFGPLFGFMPSEVIQVCSALGVDLPTQEEQKIPDSYKNA